MQWADPSMLSLICEIVTSIGGLSHARTKFLFVGVYRDSEVNQSHPFTTQYAGLQINENVNVTSINLLSFSKTDVTDMMMSELSLPRRLVSDFSHIIHRKSRGRKKFLNMLHYSHFLNDLLTNMFYFCCFIDMYNRCFVCGSAL